MISLAATRRLSRQRRSGRTPEERAARRAGRKAKRRAARERAFLTDPATFRQPLSRADALKELQAAEALQPFEANVRTYEQGIKGSERRAREEIPAWFADYGRKVTGAAQATGAAFDESKAFLTKNIADAERAAADRQAQLTSQLQTDAAQRGANLDVEGIQRASQAQSARSALAGIQSAALSGVGAAAQRGLAEQGLIGQLEGLRAVREEIGRGQTLATSLADERKKQAAFRTKSLADIREGERANILDQALFGFKGTELAAKTALEKRKLREARRKDRRNYALDVREQEERERANRADEANARERARRSGRSGRGGRTPSQVRSEHRARQKALAALNAGMKVKSPQGTEISVTPQWARSNRTLLLDILTQQLGGDRRGARKVLNSWLSKATVGPLSPR